MIRKFEATVFILGAVVFGLVQPHVENCFIAALVCLVLAETKLGQND